MRFATEVCRASSSFRLVLRFSEFSDPQATPVELTVQALTLTRTIEPSEYPIFLNRSPGEIGRIILVSHRKPATKSAPLSFSPAHVRTKRGFGDNWRTPEQANRSVLRPIISRRRRVYLCSCDWLSSAVCTLYNSLRLRHTRVVSWLCRAHSLAARTARDTTLRCQSIHIHNYTPCCPPSLFCICGFCLSV
ncbi:hypothetical protein TSAR_007443 [Trichomalopsis sarcophagae]|uniref:Uncharacterized protein n=1 Tax=Trichomalopsis sarcophagae TaxID=543379 RepID=A0A232FB82_9HYME|nr:hypothetical protein TSAR_007443 [Trichomalopsis sarcophagae]